VCNNLVYLEAPL